MEKFGKMEIFRNRPGFSFIEVAISLLIVGLILGPLLLLLSTTNKESSGSLYKLMAAHYANEILEQLLQLETNPGFATLSRAAGKDVKTLLEELNVDPLFVHGSMGGPRKLSLGGIQAYLLVSPLAGVFQSRTISVDELNPDQRDFVSRGTYFQVTIKIGWNLPGENPTRGSFRHSHESTGFFRVSP